MAPECDLVVIGGGPAGSTTALYGARAGLSVCLIEKLPFPREVLCGEFLSHEVIAVLRDLGLEQELLACAPSPITRFTLCPERGPRLSELLEFTAYGLKRGVFDEMLLEAARSRGVSIEQPAEVQSINRCEGGFEVLCRKSGSPLMLGGRRVVGAYGKSSPLDKSLRRSFAGASTGLNGVKFHIPASALVGVQTDEILIVTGPDMYCGINHVGGGFATLCFLERRSEHTPSPRARIRELAENNPAFAHMVTPEMLSAVERAPIYGTGNIYFGPRTLLEDGVLMVGDAARVIAPLAGDGIGMALQGAQLLGRLLEEERQRPWGSGVFEERYCREWHKLFAARVRAAHVFQHVMLSTNLRLAGSWLLALAPSLLRPALAMTRGGRGW